MREKAFNLFNEAWNTLKKGKFYDSQNNTQLEYMLKSLWQSDYRSQIKVTILHDLPRLFAQAQVLERPPPFLLILTQLNDNHINIKLQELAVFDWVKSNASEPATFQLLNLIETFNDRNANIDSFVRTIINNMREGMNAEMIGAFSYMLYMKHPQFLEQLLKRLATFSNHSIIRDFTRAVGKKAVLTLVTIMRPADVKKLFE